MQTRTEITRSYTIEAAHRLPRVAPEHKCARLHGHSFKAEIVVAGNRDPKLGWVMDYAEISRAFQPIWKKLDHYYLNDIRGLENPTSENLAAWIWQRLKPTLPLLTEIVVAETCMSRCIYRGE